MDKGSAQQDYVVFEAGARTDASQLARLRAAGQAAVEDSLITIGRPAFSKERNFRMEPSAPDFAHDGSKVCA